MIYELSDIKLEFFEQDGLKDINKIAVSVSSGVDSSLLLYMIAKEFSLKEYDCEILPATSPNANFPEFYTEINHIIEFVKKTFPNVKIHPLISVPRDKRSPNYVDKLYNLVPKILENDVRLVALGTTENLSAELCTTDASRTADRDDTSHIALLRPYRFDRRLDRVHPLKTLNKFHIKELYDLFDICDDIYKYTRSCCRPAYDGPCKSCYSCQEKFIAFGSFDIYS